MRWLSFRKASAPDRGPTVDTHCHLLPCVDDGVSDIDEAVACIDGLTTMGFRAAVLTPHVHPEVFPDNSEPALRAAFGRFSAELATRRPAFDVHLAAEYRFDQAWLDRLYDHAGDMLRFGPDQRWLLVELSTSVEADGVDTAVDECGRQGLRLVLAHVARYGYLHGRSGTTRLEAWRDAGALLQVNLGSLVGQYGRAVQRQARLLHRRGLIDLLGTDIHQPRQLGHLRSAMDWLTGRGGIQTSAHRELAERHPAAS